MKRLFDIVVSFCGIALCAPLVLLSMMILWIQDFHSPLFTPYRIGRGGKPFRMFKLRTMVIGSDTKGVHSTAATDPRITKLGRLLRLLKIDELPQLLNVIIGDMSLVGPRPNVKEEVQRYTEMELKLLTVRPGITDIASIVFSDLNTLLKSAETANCDYNRFVRPWKSRLGILHVEHSSMILDLTILLLTVLCAVHRGTALRIVSRIVVFVGGGEELGRVALRADPLRAAPPPGASHVESHGELNLASNRAVPE